MGFSQRNLNTHIFLCSTFYISALFDHVITRQCADGFVNIKETCYHFHSKKATYDKSVEICHKMNATLAIIKNKHEETLLIEYMEVNGMPRPRQKKIKLRNKNIMTAEEKGNIQIENHEIFCEFYRNKLVHNSPYSVIPNAKIRDRIENRAILTLPKGFTVKNSSVPNSGLGVFTNIFLPAKTVLGIYEGEMKSPEQTVNKEYGWSVMMNGKQIMRDGMDPTRSNWLRYLNSPMTDKQENVLATACDGKIFYSIPKDVLPNTELMVSYGQAYDQSLGTSTIPPEIDIPVGSWQIRINSLLVKNEQKVYADGTPISYLNFHPRLQPQGDPVRLKLLLSRYNNTWNWIFERNYSFYTELKDDYLRYPFICQAVD